MKRPNHYGKPEEKTPDRFASKVLVFTYFAVTAVLLCSLVILLSLPLWESPLQGRELALALCHSSFRLAVLGTAGGLITDIAFGDRQR